jgi:hypothetical protein
LLCGVDRNVLIPTRPAKRVYRVPERRRCHLDGRDILCRIWVGTCLLSAWVCVGRFGIGYRKTDGRGIGYGRSTAARCELDQLR